MSDTNVDITNITVKDNSKKISYIIIGITAVLALIFIGIAIYSIATKSLLFPKFVPPGPENGFIAPGGEIIELTPEQIQQRKAILSQPPSTS